MTIQEYIENINNRYKLGNATEHSFRGDLQQLIESLIPTIRATNEPKRQSCGAPDFIITKKDIPVGYIEAKDIGDKDLDGEKKNGNKEQFDRYKTSLNNIFFTDYLNFHLYRNSQFVTKISIAKIIDNEIKPLTENFASFENLLKNFCTNISQTITNPNQLAQMMARKARLLAEVIEKSINNDLKNQEDSTLKEQMMAFKQILIHDITSNGFADVYSQTICYGMFAARYHDPTLPTFSRQEAYELLPKSNPFLKKLFGYIAGLDLDDRIKWIVDDLVNIFLACDVAEILKNYGQETKTEDPIIHFYETFLSEYDPALRKARGVWYTPEPVVNFIVRAVDDILKTEFDLPQGLADSSKLGNKNYELGIEKNKLGIKNYELGIEKNKLGIKNYELGIDNEIHRVQILDPATGTGTFLAEVVKQIYKKFEGQQGLWTNYVENNLLPRLNGFELLMASYAMAHLKLDMLLTETGYKSITNQRLRIFLTNSLEESYPDSQTLFAQWLSNEANEASHLKRDTPVMCVIGNPPYAVSSSNKGQWIYDLIADYKKNLKETKINLDDDYIKFIRLGQHFVDKNRSGILAYISNNSFIDGVTHRQMRKHLLESFDKIYILNLHGNARKKETCEDGSTDQNVFDIMQGVSINIFVKTSKKQKNELAQVFYTDLQGKRELKFNFLKENNLKSINWKILNYSKPYYFFVPKNFDNMIEYEKGIKVNEIFNENVAGIETIRDYITIHFNFDSLKNVVNDFLNLTEAEISRKYKTIDARDWKIQRAKDDIKLNINNSSVWQNINYRPFDIRKTFYTGKQNGFVCNGRFNVMKHLLKDNLGVIIKRGFEEEKSAPVFITKFIIDRRGWTRPGMQGAESIFPLYIYPEKDKQINNSNLEAKLEEAKVIFENFKKSFNAIKKIFESLQNPDNDIKQYYKQQEKIYQKFLTDVQKFEQQLATASNGKIFEDEKRTPNLNKEIVKQISENLGLTFTNEKESDENSFAPIDILDYIYAVLHSPTYREKYKEFLKIDFPRVPYPKDLTKFRTLAKLGEELRQIHLLESAVVENYITQYPVDGDNFVRKYNFVKVLNFAKVECGKVYINDTQYFDNVPEIAWNFYIGGYQPAQKWLKDRKDRKLDSEEILHYQKIIVALTETVRLMNEIDKIQVD